MKFDQFSTIINEARFRQSSKQLVEQVKKIASIYFNQYNSNNVDIKELIEQDKICSFKDNKHYKEYFSYFELKKMPKYFTPSDNLVAKVTITDLETNEPKTIDVYCIYGDIGDTEYAAYGYDYDSINIYDNNMKDLSERLVQSKILHELTHGFQQYKEQSKKFQKMLGKDQPFDWETYYKAPTEIDSHFNEIAYNINQKHREFLNGIVSTKELSIKKLLKMRLETFMKELKVFIETPLESYTELEELPLPKWTESIEDFLKTIKTDKKLWNKFKQKLINLYNNLEKKSVRILQRNSLIQSKKLEEF